MRLKMDPSVKFAQALFFVLFAVLVYLLADGGLLTSYYGLMAFAAGGAVLAVFTIYKNDLFFGLIDLALIVGSFLWYMMKG
ncbi:MAG: hypothetical protein VB085_02520 [Peptococcaceae bacterium]|nr:hypothetical protein [Peptococcaceae bacterium]